MSNFGSFSYFQTSLSLGVEQGLQKLPKFDINDLKHLFHYYILIPRKCPRKTPFKTQYWYCGRNLPPPDWIFQNLRRSPHPGSYGPEYWYWITMCEPSYIYMRNSGSRLLNLTKFRPEKVKGIKNKIHKNEIGIVTYSEKQRNNNS